MDEKEEKNKLPAEKRERERRWDTKSARENMGMEKRLDERRTGKPRRRGPGVPNILPQENPPDNSET